MTATTLACDRCGSPLEVWTVAGRRMLACSNQDCEAPPRPLPPAWEVEWQGAARLPGMGE